MLVSVDDPSCSVFGSRWQHLVVTACKLEILFHVWQLMFCTCGVKAVIMRLELSSHPQPLNMQGFYGMFVILWLLVQLEAVIVIGLYMNLCRLHSSSWSSLVTSSRRGRWGRGGGGSSWSSDVHLSLWRMWFCTTGLDQPLDWVHSYRGRRSSWRHFHVGLFQSSAPGSPQLPAAPCPSNPPNHPPSSRTHLWAGHAQLKIDKRNLKKVMLINVQVPLNCYMKIRRNPKTSQKAWSVSPRLRCQTKLNERSADRLDTKTAFPS